MTHELHPLCVLFPRLVGTEFDALRDDIAANGLRSPIVLHDGMILDGGNRYRACVEAGIEPTFEEFAGGNLVSYVLSVNLHRRHMSPGQQAAIVATAQDWGRANIQGRNTITCHVAGDTVADRAALSGASERTQLRADKVARADPGLATMVAHGELSLPQAVEMVDSDAVERLVRSTRPAHQMMAGEAMWLWNRIREFEQHGIGKFEPLRLLGEMTPGMQADVARLIPAVATFFNGCRQEVFDAQSSHGGAE